MLSLLLIFCLDYIQKIIITIIIIIIIIILKYVLRVTSLFSQKEGRRLGQAFVSKEFLL